MRTRQYFPVPAHIRTITDVVTRTGFALDPEHPHPAMPRLAQTAVNGIVHPDTFQVSSSSHALFVKAGTVALSSLNLYDVPMRARTGHTLVAIAANNAHLQSAVFLAGEYDLLKVQDPIGQIVQDVSRALIAERGGVEVSRTELKTQLFRFLYSGARVPTNGAVDPVAYVQVANAIREAFPQLGQYVVDLTAEQVGNAAVNRYANDATWKALVPVVADLADIATPVMVVVDEVVLEVADSDVDEVLLRAPRPLQHSIAEFVPAIAADVVVPQGL